ncbi:MAG: flagellin [Candidatus Gastranaerophilales bacterium]|nr:flagellin [Candidatus Gastranaerophilales bacterium]
MNNMQINNDTNSSIVQRSLNVANKEAVKSIEKIAHGKQMNAIQDAAGSIIADQLEIQSRGSQGASENVQAGANLLQTADSDLGNITDNLQKMRELTLKAANGTNGKEELDAIKSEISSLSDEIDRVSETSSFNEMKLLDGSNSNLSLQVGANSDSKNNSMQIGSALNSVSTDSLNIPKNLDQALDSAGSSQMLESIDNALSTVNDRRSSVGAMQNVLSSALDNLHNTSENLTAAQSRIRDTDVAKESSNLIKSQILQNASGSLLAQTNQKSSSVLALLGVEGHKL